MKKKIEHEETEEKILEIIDDKRTATIREVTLILQRDYGIRISPQITKRYLLKLKRERRIR